jgi:hypothetical protein
MIRDSLSIFIVFLFWTSIAHDSCSSEHENTITPFLGTNTAQIDRQT